MANRFDSRTRNPENRAEKRARRHERQSSQQITTAPGYRARLTRAKATASGETNISQYFGGTLSPYEVESILDRVRAELKHGRQDGISLFVEVDESGNEAPPPIKDLSEKLSNLDAPQLQARISSGGHIAALVSGGKKARHRA